MSVDHTRRQRTILEKLKCGLGIHDYGEPQVMESALVFRGEKTDDGWETEVEESPDPDRRVIQLCDRPNCHASKERPNLDPDDYAMNSDPGVDPSETSEDGHGHN